MAGRGRWANTVPWQATIPEGVDDLTLHATSCEWRTQIKSRHDPQSTFSVREIASYLGKIARNLPMEDDDQVRMALVLERGVDNLNPTGWEDSLLSSGQSIEGLNDALAAELGVDAVAVRDLLAKAHLIVEADPISRGAACLEAKTSLRGAASRLCMQRLRERAGETADRNYLAEATAPATFGPGEIQAAIDSVAATIDPAGYQVLTGGLCEIADFGEPLPAEGFYSGVDVQPGHIGAGLVFTRPDPIAEILKAIKVNRAALIAGPSGSGKSALAWLAAYETRHAVRWYRVRQLRAADVLKLAQVARLVDATVARPVGFVIDDLGREATQGWDDLVREAQAQAGIYLLGTVREEDIFSLASANILRVVRPLLDEDLAQRIWAALRTDEQTKAAFWREAFEQSNQLLLEFTHLLTSGERLADTIREQMRRRIAEGRDDEIEILRPVVFAAAHGATVREDRLRDRLNWPSPRFARAITRLENEHALRRRADGVLTGLHEIRSIHIDDALRTTLNEPVETALQQSISDLAVSDFQIVIVRVLRRWPSAQSSLHQGFADRLAEGEPNALAATLHGLGLATCDRIADAWLKITRDVGIDDRIASTLLMLTLGGADLSIAPQFAKAAEAKARYASVCIEDLRCSIPSGLITGARCKDAQALLELLGALLPIQGAAGTLPLPSITVAKLDDASLDTILEILRTAHVLVPAYAQELADTAGGTEALLQRVRLESPWITEPVLSREGDNVAVSSDVRFVSEKLQPDIHADVVRLCERLFGAVPAATLVISRAVFADGRLAGTKEYPMADKRLARTALVVPATVSWNRALLRAVQRLLSGETETGRQIALANAIIDVTKMLKEAAEMYCRGQSPGSKWQLMLHVRQILTELVPAPKVDEAIPNALTKGEYAGIDSAFDFAKGVATLCSALTSGSAEELKFGGHTALELSRTAKSLNDADAWRLIDTPPFEALTEVADILTELRAVLGEATVDPEFRRRLNAALGKRSKHHAALPKAAVDARSHAQQRVEAHCRDVRQAFADAGQEVHVFHRPRPKDSGYVWPDVEYAVIMEAASILEWMPELEQLPIIAARFEGMHLAFAPLIDGVVAPLAGILLTSLLPYPKFAEEWGSHVSFPMLTDPVLTRYDEALDTATTLSAAVQGDGRQLTQLEVPLVQGVVDQIRAHMAYFSDLVTASPGEELIFAGQFLAACFQRALAELDGVGTEKSLASVAHGAITGNPDPEFTTGVLGARIVLIDRALRLRASRVN